MEPNNPQHPTETPKDRIPLGRAAFLGTIAAGAIGVGLISRMGGVGVGGIVGSIGNAVPSMNGIVPTNGWRIYNVQDPMPTFDPATYTLTVDGEVENPVKLTWSAVQETPMVTSISDLSTSSAIRARFGSIPSRQRSRKLSQESARSVIDCSTL